MTYRRDGHIQLKGLSTVFWYSETLTEIFSSLARGSPRDAHWDVHLDPHLEASPDADVELVCRSKSLDNFAIITNQLAKVSINLAELHSVQSTLWMYRRLAVFGGLYHRDSKGHLRSRCLHLLSLDVLELQKNVEPEASSWSWQMASDARKLIEILH